jgi:sphingolipid delta-4 desaturase
LVGPAPSSAAVIGGLVAAHLGVACVARDAPAWAITALAYTIGAVLTVGLFNMLHEASHGLVFRSRTLNHLAAFVANTALVWPAAESFFEHHGGHHRHLGDYDRDVSVPRRWEARLAGSGFLGKAVWLSLYPLVYPCRVFAMTRGRRRASPWTIANLLTQAVADAAILWALGPRALAYLALSYLFAFGLHPLSAMTVQEHSLSRAGQDSYSYYGVGNLLTFNTGYHQEHHDLPRVPWSRLPRLRRLAPELYEDEHAYRSWTRLLTEFLLSPRWSLWRRGVRGIPD